MNIADFENMSDDDFEKVAEPAFEAPVEQQEEQQQEQEPIIPPVEDEGTKDEAEADAGGAEGDDKEGEKPKDEDLSDDDLDKQTPPVEDKTPPAEKPEGEQAPVDDKKPEPKAAAEKKDPPKEGDKPAVESEKKPEEQTLDYKAEFEKLVGKPIKANGKEITLKNTDEVLRLVQQGAGYAQKMEQLKPARKSAAMLEAAGYLGDEAALSHMIDLYNGDPKAIAKMVKDLKIDIFALDLDAGDQYKPTSHLQSDEAVNFTDALKEVRTLEGGREALGLIDAMDQKSKDLIWGNAQAIREIYDLKQSGVYDTVATEVQRRRTLGQIPADVPFIVAFQAVGEEIAKTSEAQQADPAVERPVVPVVAEPAKPAQRTPVASGPAPRKVETPDARAVAAASPRSGLGKAAQPIDIYAYSDADIEKMSAPPV
jgi:hypothetical protein